MFFKHTSIIFSFFLILSFSNAQISGYEMEFDYEPYEPLEEYESILIENLGYNIWDKKFDLPFEFPFFDSTYNHLIGYYDNIWDIEGSVDFCMYLFSYDYNFDIITDPRDTVNIQSDVRYHYTERDGKQALVVEFFNNRLHDDPSVDEHDSYVNFQDWFYEDGTIEIRFGAFNLDHSPYYVPGEGFWLPVNGNDSILIGPFVGIQDPFQTDKQIGLDGTFEDFEVVSPFQTLTTIPDSGFVIRFKRIPVSADNTTIEDKNITIYPSPTNDMFKIIGNDVDKVESVHVLVHGKFIELKQFSDQYDVSFLPSGIYYIVVNCSDKKQSLKLIKI
jgi:hypothetical protein